MDHFYIRAIIYITISFSYFSFMNNYAPLGIDWLEWHHYKIFNFSDFLKLNGYFSTLGFSVITSCKSCPIDQDQIYTSRNIFSFFPYVLINHFFDFNNLKVLGSILDKAIIVLSGILVSEIIILLTKIKSNIKYYLSFFAFVIFLINPWTYKMYISQWPIVYFILFFLIGLYFLIIKKKISFLFFLIGGLIDYQSSAGLFIFYFTLFIISIYYQKNSSFSFYPYNNSILMFNTSFFLIIPIIIFFILKFLIINKLGLDDGGSSLLERIGISGNDIHNGGILGSLQFLAGNRLNVCLVDNNFIFDKNNLTKTIFIYNCILSHISMIVVSLISIVGIYFGAKNNNLIFKIIILPLIFLFLNYTFILQQSSSVHLNGYSYLFSLIFSFGLLSILTKILIKYKFSPILLFFLFPFCAGIVILCIRVSMLTGING